MGFSRDIFDEARAQLTRRRDKAETLADQRRQEVFERCPEYERLTRELSSTCAQLAVVIFRHGNDVPDVAAIRDRNLEIQARMAELLGELGIEPESLKPQYECPICKDTGIDDSHMCACLKRLMRSIAFERMNRDTPLAISSFESFSLGHYSDQADAKGLSPRRIMEITLKKCRAYAESFSLGSPSLLFQGGVGLGKTHLSLAIAGEVINKGYGVVYGSVNNLFSRIEDEHFSRTAKTSGTRELLCDCDLLILDDLGTEFSTQFTVSVLYDVINTRLLRSRPTIISTNLDMGGLEQKYSERVVSRITGSYNRYPFAGSDMRIVMRKARRDGAQ